MPRIGDVYGQPENAGNIRRGEGRRAERAPAERPEAEGATRSRESASDDVREIRGHQARLIDAARNAPDVRADRVAQARARVQEGFYDRPETRAAVADRMLRSFEGKSSS